MPSTRTRRATAAPWVALGAAGVAWLGVALAAPGDGGPVLCPFRWLTGLDCPFCGATRAAASLAHGDLVAALDHNALFVLVLLPGAIVGWLVWLRRARTGRPLPIVSDRALIVGLVGLGVWWALRLVVPWLGSGLAA